MPEIHRHTDTKELERYSQGNIPQSEADRIEEHLLPCESCRHQLEETELYIASMRRHRRNSNSSPRSSWWRRNVPVLTLAACAIMMLLVALPRNSKTARGREPDSGPRRCQSGRARRKAAVAASRSDRHHTGPFLPPGSSEPRRRSGVGRCNGPARSRRPNAQPALRHIFHSSLHQVQASCFENTASKSNSSPRTMLLLSPNVNWKGISSFHER